MDWRSAQVMALDWAGVEPTPYLRVSGVQNNSKAVPYAASAASQTFSRSVSVMWKMPLVTMTFRKIGTTAPIVSKSHSR